MCLVREFLGSEAGFVNQAMQINVYVVTIVAVVKMLAVDAEAELNAIEAQHWDNGRFQWTIL